MAEQERFELSLWFTQTNSLAVSPLIASWVLLQKEWAPISQSAHLTWKENQNEQLKIPDIFYNQLSAIEQLLNNLKSC